MQPQVAQQIQAIEQQLQAIPQQMQAMQQQMQVTQEQMQVIQGQMNLLQASLPVMSLAAGAASSTMASTMVSPTTAVVPHSQHGQAPWLAGPSGVGMPPGLRSLSQQLLPPIDCWWMNPLDPDAELKCKYAGKHCRTNSPAVYWVHFSNPNHRGGVHALLCHSCGLANRAEIDGLIHV